MWKKNQLWDCQRKKAVLPFKAKGVDAGELNWIDMVGVAVPRPIPAAET